MTVVCSNREAWERLAVTLGSVIFYIGKGSPFPHIFIEKYMQQHRIRINQISAGKYAVTGAVSMPSTPAPVPDAARELLAPPGVSPDDELQVTCGECSIIPMSLGAILNERQTPNRIGMMRALIGQPESR